MVCSGIRSPIPPGIVMMRNFKSLAAVFAFSGFNIGAGGMETFRPLDWPKPVMENRPACYWWWMGSAVDRENLTWNLEALKAAGVGGVSIVPIYGVQGNSQNNIPYLGPRWLEMLDHSVSETKRLGMWADMTTGTGWPFGGPSVAKEDADSVIRFENGAPVVSYSGRDVKRAAPGGVGRSLDPYSPQAMKRYLRNFDDAFAMGRPKLPRAQYHDSFEYEGNWSSEVPQAFLRKHGYDLMDHLPALFGQGDVESVSRIKADYREVLSDLHLAAITTWADWAAGHGMLTRNQAHGGPGNLLDLYAASDIPETEIFGSTPFMIPGIRREPQQIAGDIPRPLMNRMASSAAHVAGKKLVAAETCTWVRNHFHSALSQLKPEVDQLFLAGINHIFFHGSCYSPRDASWPGWLFYASLQYNPRNSIWRDVPLLNEYVTRCQSVLQSGTHDNDVALYWPVHDVWHSPTGLRQSLSVHSSWLSDSACGRTAAALIRHGYGFDYVSDRQLTAGLARSHAVIVVPKTGHMPVETLRNLLARADAGQPVIFLDALPADVPGFGNLDERRAEFMELLRNRGKLVCPSRELHQALAKTRAVREVMVDTGLSFIRRCHEQGHHYFVANMGAAAVNAWVPLGKSFKSAVIMDPRSALSGVAAQREGNEIHIRMEPGETRIIRTLATRMVEGPAWRALSPSDGRPHEITGDWNIRFIDGGPSLPEPIQTRQLKSWTGFGQDKAAAFAGTARYTIEFEMPATPAPDDWVIDLGDVRESARVSINGRPAANLWCVPFRAPAGSFLKPGTNRLEIEVTNLSANRIRDLDARKVQWKIFDEINFVDIHYKPFDASGWPVVPSGLLGPVRLIPMKLENP